MDQIPVFSITRVIVAFTGRGLKIVLSSQPKNIRLLHNFKVEEREAPCKEMLRA